MVLLCILDGFGLREETADNAVAAAFKPNYEEIRNKYPTTVIDGSGKAVGLPDGQMGNSEVGHLNLGAGRIVHQDITRINKAIEDGNFFKNEILTSSITRIVNDGKALHLIGLVSDGGVHSSMEHLFALVKLAKQQGVTKLYLHALMDGRDTPPQAGKKQMAEVVKKFSEIGLGQVVTVMGRYYGMDRDKRWERSDKAFRAIIYREGIMCDDPASAINSSYADDVSDEFILPRVIRGESENSGLLCGDDLVVIFNFRADRVRQLSHLLLGHQMGEFKYPDQPEIELVTMTNYDSEMTEAKVMFKPILLTNILGGVLSSANKRQLRMAETEKYAHVTFFFNGGVEKAFEGEDRELVPSPKVATYDMQPEMSSEELTDIAVAKIKIGKYDFVLLNYANCDMVGHTGDFDAAKKAVEAVDRGLGKLLEAVKSQSGVAIVTADHGNAEMMINPADGGPWTAHTTNLVPCICFDPSGSLGKIKLRPKGILADIAPTVLDIMQLSIPEEMTGESLLIRG